MKAGIFALTKNEQRVVILVLLTLLAAAFVRYWNNVKSAPPNRPNEASTSGSPLPMDETRLDAEQASGDDSNKAQPVPSP